jgi:hypothetical protein
VEEIEHLKSFLESSGLVSETESLAGVLEGIAMGYVSPAELDKVFFQRMTVGVDVPPVTYLPAFLMTIGNRIFEKHNVVAPFTGKVDDEDPQFVV